MSTEDRDPLSEALRGLVAEVEDRVVTPDARQVVARSVRVAKKRRLIGAHGIGLRRTAIAGAAAAVLAGIALAATSLLPTSPRARADPTTVALLQLASKARLSAPLVRPPAAFYHLTETGAALVEGPGFAGLVERDWAAWYQPGGLYAALSPPVFEAGRGARAWGLAQKPSPDWETLWASPPGRPHYYPAATPFPMSTAVSPTVRASWQLIGTNLGWLSGVPGPSGLAQLVAALVSPSAGVRSGALLSLERARYLHLIKTVHIPGETAKRAKAFALFSDGMELEFSINQSSGALIGYEVVVSAPKAAATNYPGLKGLTEGEVLAWVRVNATSIVRSLPSRNASHGLSLTPLGP